MTLRATWGIVSVDFGLLISLAFTGVCLTNYA